MEEILKKDFSTIYKKPPPGDRAARTILSPERSLGSVIKLMTPSQEYTDEHNDWVATSPANHPPVDRHREALLPARIGAKTGASTSASTASTATKAMS